MIRILVHSLALLALALSGCIARLSTYDQERVDQEIKGNRGFVRGKPALYSPKEKKKTKKIYKLEVELGPFVEGEKAAEEKGAATAENKGYLKKTVISGEPEKPGKKAVTRLRPFGSPAQPQVIFQRPLGTGADKGTGVLSGEKALGEEIPNTYVVEKGDTLQKISNKFYGTTKRWKAIYEVNKDTLKSPDLIKPGQKLVIPEK